MRLMIVRHAEPNYEKACITDLGHVQVWATVEAAALRPLGPAPFGKLPLGRGGIRKGCEGRGQEKTAVLYLDGSPVGQASQVFSWNVPLSRGRHSLSVVSGSERADSEFEVK